MSPGRGLGRTSKPADTSLLQGVRGLARSGTRAPPSVPGLFTFPSDCDNENMEINMFTLLAPNTQVL